MNVKRTEFVDDTVRALGTMGLRQLPIITSRVSNIWPPKPVRKWSRENEPRTWDPTVGLDERTDYGQRFVPGWRDIVDAGTALEVTMTCGDIGKREYNAWDQQFEKL